MYESTIFALWSKLAAVTRIECEDQRCRRGSDFFRPMTAAAADRSIPVVMLSVMNLRFPFLEKTPMGSSLGTCKRRARWHIRRAARTGQSCGFASSRAKVISSPFCPFF